MKRGVIKLVSKSDEVIRTSHYWQVGERRAAIEKWRKQYGARFKECFIHIIPDVNHVAVAKDGKNMRFKKGADDFGRKYIAAYKRKTITNGKKKGAIISFDYNGS